MILASDKVVRAKRYIAIDDFCLNQTSPPVQKEYDLCCPPLQNEDLLDMLHFKGNLNGYTPDLKINSNFIEVIQAYVDYRGALDPCFSEFTFEYSIQTPYQQPRAFNYQSQYNITRGATVFRPGESAQTTWGQPTLSNITLDSNKWYRIRGVVYGGPISCSMWKPEGCENIEVEFRLQSSNNSSGKRSNKLLLRDVADLKKLKSSLSARNLKAKPKRSK